MASENLKKVVLIVTKLVTEGETVFKDGFQFTDVFAFIPELSQIPDIIKNGPALAAELKALDSAGLKDIETFVDNALVLEDKNLEAIIEAVIAVIVAVLNLIAKIKPKPAPPVV